jgi:hypothetical protein
MCARGTVTLHACSAWTRIWIGTGNSCHGPDHEASPRARYAAGPRTDSDGTSLIAFTTARMGGDCAQTELLRNVPNRKTHASGPGGSRVFHIRPARGPRPPGTSTSSRPLRARIDPNNTCGATTRILLPVMFTRRTTGGITTETVICAPNTSPYKRRDPHEEPWKQSFSIRACWFRISHPCLHLLFGTLSPTLF